MMQNLRISFDGSLRWIVAAAVSVLVGGSSPAQALLVGVDFSGNFWNIERLTAVGTMIGPTGFTELNALAADSAGTLYSATSSQLITLDIFSGVGRPGPALTLGADPVAIQAMAFADDGLLYAANDGNGAGSTGNYDLWSIDVQTGTGTFIGDTGARVQGLDFFRGGTMFGYAVAPTTPEDGPGLGTVDLSSGEYTDLDPDAPTFDIHAVSFAALAPNPPTALLCCELLGAGDNLYGIDRSSGHVIDIGMIDPNSQSSPLIRGMQEFIFVPEPGTSLVVSALVCLMARRRKLVDMLSDSGSA